MREVTRRVEGGGSYTVKEYVLDSDGRYIYDRYDIPAGETYPYSFSVPKVPEGQTPQLKSVDVKLVDNRGVVYGKNNIDLAHVERIVITSDDMYPMLNVQNNTGFPVYINAPNTGIIGNGNSVAIYQIKVLGSAENVVVSYNSGTFSYRKDVTVGNEHTVLTLTENDRPPIVNILNNTEKTINLVNLRNSGGRWDGVNILTLDLKEDGTVENLGVGTQAGERRGSLTNKEAFNFWLGNLKVNPGSYDIRLDNVQGDSYVKNNVQITGDVTLTFTQEDKP